MQTRGFLRPWGRLAGCGPGVELSSYRVLPVEWDADARVSQTLGMPRWL
jgi:hypothetical protein